MPFPREGPKEWTPRRIDIILSGLEELTIDSEKEVSPGGGYGVVEFIEEEKVRLKAYHVTDDPENTRKEIKQAVEAGGFESPKNSYECGGLLVSLNPRSKSVKKWDFLKSLSIAQKYALEKVVYAQLKADRGLAYISKAEFMRGVEYIRDWKEQDNIELLLVLAYQPYNIPINKLAQQNDIAEPFEPVVVPVIFEGRYLLYNDRSQWFSLELAAHHLGIPLKDVEMVDLCRTWRELGWDGYFVSSGVAKELTILNPEKIVVFADRAGRRLSGRLAGRDGGTVQVGKRFETSLSPNHEMAILQEIGRPSRMFGPMRLPAVLELGILVDRLRMGLEPQEGRFKADLSGELPAIVDTQIYRRISVLSDEDLAEMLILLEELAREMAQ